MKDGRNDTPVCFKCGADLEWSEEYRRWECPMFAKHPENAAIAPPPMSETPLALDPLDLCRAAFESWLKEQTKHRDQSHLLDRRSNGEYSFNPAHMEWRVWQAAWSALASSPPQAPAPTSPEFQAWWESHIARWGYKPDTEELVRDACAEAWAVARTPAAPPQEPAAPWTRSRTDIQSYDGNGEPVVFLYPPDESKERIAIRGLDCQKTADRLLAAINGGY